MSETGTEFSWQQKATNSRESPGTSQGVESSSKERRKEKFEKETHGYSRDVYSSEVLYVHRVFRVLRAAVYVAK